jgi:hypothetical protein
MGSACGPAAKQGNTRDGQDRPAAGTQETRGGALAGDGSRTPLDIEPELAERSMAPQWRAAETP